MVLIFIITETQHRFHIKHVIPSKRLKQTFSAFCCVVQPGCFPGAECLFIVNRATTFKRALYDAGYMLPTCSFHPLLETVRLNPKSIPFLRNVFYKTLNQYKKCFIKF